MVSRALANSLLNVYKTAWENQDPEKILTIFTKDATYHERLHEKPFRGHDQIKKYWVDKVVGEQEDIKFKLKKIYVDGNSAIAEWEARFYDKKKKVRTHLKEIAVLEIRGDKIGSLREYWHSKHTR